MTCMETYSCVGVTIYNFTIKSSFVELGKLQMNDCFFCKDSFYSILLLYRHSKHVFSGMRDTGFIDIVDLHIKKH